MSILTVFANIHDSSHFLNFNKSAWEHRKSNDGYIATIFNYVLSTYSSNQIVFLSNYVKKHQWRNSYHSKISKIKRDMIQNIKDNNFIGNSGFGEVIEGELISGKWTKNGHTELTTKDVHKLYLTIQNACQHILSTNWPIVDKYVLPQFRGFYQTESERKRKRPAQSIDLPKAFDWFNFHHVACSVVGVHRPKYVKDTKNNRKLAYHVLTFLTPKLSNQYETLTYSVLLNYLKYAIKRAKNNQSIKTMTQWS